MTTQYAELAELRFMSETQSGELSAFACRRCSFHLPKEEEEDFIKFYAHTTDEEIPCQSCGKGFTFDRYLTTIEPASTDLLIDEEARTSYWYHATTVSDWLNVVLYRNDMEEGEIPFVHVGTKEAALDRAKMQYFRNGIYNVMLIKVALKDTASLSPSIHKDTNWWPAVADEESFAEFRGDAIRYINRFEMPGSISLLVDPRQLEMLSELRLYPDMV